MRVRPTYEQRIKLRPFNKHISLLVTKKYKSQIIHVDVTPLGFYTIRHPYFVLRSTYRRVCIHIVYSTSFTKRPARRFLQYSEDRVRRVKIGKQPIDPRALLQAEQEADCSVESSAACNLAHAPLAFTRALSQPEHNSTGFHGSIPLPSSVNFYPLKKIQQIDVCFSRCRLDVAARKILTVASLRATTISSVSESRPLTTGH